MHIDDENLQQTRRLTKRPIAARVTSFPPHRIAYARMKPLDAGRAHHADFRKERIDAKLSSRMAVGPQSNL